MPGMLRVCGKRASSRSKGDPRANEQLQFLRRQHYTKKSKQVRPWKRLPAAPKTGGQGVGHGFAENMPFGNPVRAAHQQHVQAAKWEAWGRT